MSILTASIKNPTSLEHPLFHLSFSHTKRRTKMTMTFRTSLFNTSYYPHTHEILTKEHPRVLRTKCFNEGNLPFSVEVKNTEMAHLFEHILLDNLCQLRVADGYKHAKYSGVTSWDWSKDVEGTFHITLSAGESIETIFPFALQKTIALLTKVMESSTTSLLPTYNKSPLTGDLLQL